MRHGGVSLSPRAEALLAKLEAFVHDECIPADAIFEREIEAMPPGERFSKIPAILASLKDRARSLGLWNLFLAKEEYGDLGAGLTNAEYAVLCEVTGRSRLAPEACNCSAPDSGNMEVLAKFGTAEQKRRFLSPLLEGRVRSAFLMTEPDVASSDASNIACAAEKFYDGRGRGFYRITGRKWWATGACDPRLGLAIVLCRLSDGSARRHRQHSMFVVPLPSPRVTVVRPLTTFGYDDAPFGHAEVLLDGVVVPESCLLLGEGRGFDIAQGRLGPGRVHHCMRALGIAERALEAAVQRAGARSTFGKALIERDTVQSGVAECRLQLDQARLLVVRCAAALDAGGSKSEAAQMDIAAIKVVVPRAAFRALDFALQIHGGLGVCQDTFIARSWAAMRTLRLADGPDEVHLRTVARLAIKGLSRAKL